MIITRHHFDPTILREYDIRGTTGVNLASPDALALGKAFGTVIRADAGPGARCCVAYDGRPTSPVLEESFIEGLNSTGIDAVRIGLGPTPLLYFSVYQLSAAAGVMITGSHNPPDMNGFKLMLGRSSYFGENIQRLAKIAADGDFATGNGKVDSQSVQESYLEAVSGAWPAWTGNVTSVAWDPGNGAAGEITAALVQRLHSQHVVINSEVDGSFPNHHPDPSVSSNLIQLQEVVADRGCSLGIALDGDGDRIGVIDGRGRILWPDQLLAILAREVIATKPGSLVIGDVKCSQILFNEVERLGGTPMIWKTGHALIKEKMAETRAPLAGEMSGHIFFGDRYYGYDDALYAAVRLLAYLDRQSDSLAEIFDSLPHSVNTPEIRFDCPEDRKFVVIEEVRNRMVTEGADVNDTDGVRVTTEDGWWLLRASNTQAALVARAEAVEQGGLLRLRDALAKQLEQSGVSLPTSMDEFPGSDDAELTSS